MEMIIIRTLLTLFAVLILTGVQHAAAQSYVKIENQGKLAFGRPLGWDGKKIALLRRDGMLTLHPAKKQDIIPLPQEFKPFSMAEFQQAFFKEYRNRYDVSKTEHLIVVHPWGSPKTWAHPFEEFHNRFVNYFTSNGYKLSEPEFPMVAIVLRSRNDFDRSLINEVQRHDRRIQGYYSRVSNHITTYDPSATLRNDRDRWMYSSWSIIHEATHQSAFNTGVHNRFAPPPNWLSEGLATMFEANGINNPEQFPKPEQRVNVRRLKQIRKYLDSEQFYDGMINLVANDKLFFTHLDMAYAISWGMTFYLAETQPDNFFEYIRKDASRKNFVEYTSEQRLRDFAKAFGNDFDGFAKKLQKYYRVKK